MNTLDQDKIVKFDELTKHITRWQEECLYHINQAKIRTDSGMYNRSVECAIECCDDIKKELEKIFIQ